MNPQGEDSMSETYQSLSHSKWDCKYHVVFVPKRRRKAIFGQTRRQLGAIFHALARQKECQIIEGHLIARLSGKERNFSGEHFWARGYAVSTVGFELEQVRTYIREQEAADGAVGQF
jgi:putative transposase